MGLVKASRPLNFGYACLKCFSLNITVQCEGYVKDVIKQFNGYDDSIKDCQKGFVSVILNAVIRIKNSFSLD
ncbi:MAG: hypothetical protein CL666_14910 [Balneola sp.]|nr:hypothetical protein [Balneola sp.]